MTYKLDKVFKNINIFLNIATYNLFFYLRTISTYYTFFFLKKYKRIISFFINELNNGLEKLNKINKKVNSNFIGSSFYLIIF